MTTILIKDSMGKYFFLSCYVAIFDSVKKNLRDSINVNKNEKYCICTITHPKITSL